MRIFVLVLVLFTTACGINLKTPPDLGVKVNLDAKGLTDNVRTFMNTKIRPEYLRFLKDSGLKQYIADQGRRYNARCLVPTKRMVEFENQETVYAFTLYQRCYFEDTKENKIKELTFDISGSVDVKTLRYQFAMESAPEFSINTITEENYQKVSETHSFLDDSNL